MLTFRKSLLLMSLTFSSFCLPTFAITYSNQMMTTWAPAASGCTIPASMSTFLTTNNTIYLFFTASVTTSDHLSFDLVAPDNTILTGGSWGTTSGNNKCFTGAKLSVGNLPTTRLGSWRARVWNNGNILLFSLQFYVIPPPKQIQITGISGWTAQISTNPLDYAVLNGQWQGQPPAAGSSGSGHYKGFYAIDYYPNTSFWTISGSGFGTRGTITFSDPSIIVDSTPSWSDSSIRVWLHLSWPGFTQMGYQNSPLTFTITSTSTATNGSVVILGQGNKSVSVVSTIQTRGYGQCTWYVASQRLLNSPSRTIPYPGAYSITGFIDATYTPQQWDVIDFGTRKANTAAEINGAHTAIITSPVTVTQSAPASDGSKILTYTFTIGEMNVKPGWGETVTNPPKKTTFAVKVSKTGVRSSVTTQLYSDYSAAAIAFFH